MGVGLAGIALMVAPIHGAARSQATFSHAQDEGRAAVAALAPQVRRARLVARPADPGEPVLTLRIPRLSGAWVVFEGTGPEVLERGPGHYTGTALPGETGNVAIAAHRAGHGSPFLRFDELRRGDPVMVGQGDVRWTYVVITEPRVIDQDDDWVLAPSTRPLLTLTTCWPRYGSSRRMYVRARLAGTQLKASPGTALPRARRSS